MNRWDLLLLALGIVVAVGSLVRLMRHRRDMLIADYNRQLQAHRKRRAAARAKDEAA